MKNQTRVNEALKKVDELCDIYNRSINETSNYEQDD